MQNNEWIETRKMGKTKYVLKHGILYYGVPLGIIIGLFSNIVDKGWHFDITLAFSGIAGAIFGVVIGFIYGHIDWHFNEKTWLKNQ